MNDRDVRKKDRRKHRKVEHENVKWYGKKEWLNEKEKMRDRDDDNEIGKKIAQYNRFNINIESNNLVELQDSGS